MLLVINNLNLQPVLTKVKQHAVHYIPIISSFFLTLPLLIPNTFPTLKVQLNYYDQNKLVNLFNIVSNSVENVDQQNTSFTNSFQVVLNNCLRLTVENTSLKNTRNKYAQSHNVSLCTVAPSPSLKGLLIAGTRSYLSGVKIEF